MPKAERLDPIIADFSRARDVDAALALLDVSLAMNHNAGSFPEECKKVEARKGDFAELGPVVGYLCTYTLGLPTQAVSLLPVETSSPGHCQHARGSTTMSTVSTIRRSLPSCCVSSRPTPKRAAEMALLAVQAESKNPTGEYRRHPIGVSLSPQVATVRDPSVVVLRPGIVFQGRYHVLRCIKAGGMGAVHEVLDEKTNTRRALKVMLPSLVESTDMRARFAQEARVCGGIQSDHIVHVTDAGVDDETGTPFLVMELLQGEELGEMLARRGRLPAQEVVACLFQAALALDKTHDAGIVHRDLKPENLFITTRDDGSACLKILDFGIAKVVAHSNRPHTTQSAGTPLYMAPEQVQGKAVIGPRADTYALGHIAFTLLVGEAYWTEELKSEALLPFFSKVACGIPEPASRRAARRGVSFYPPFDAWFYKATAVQAEDRYARASDAISALGKVLGVPLLRPSFAVFDPVASSTEDIAASSTFLVERAADANASTLGSPVATANGDRRKQAADMIQAFVAAPRLPMPPNNLPVRREFVGRADDLSAVHAALGKDRKASIVQAAAVYGLGGVGKTALALEYAHRHATAYPGGVWWLHAEGSPMDGMLRLSTDLRLLAPPSVRSVVESVPIVDGKAADLARAARLGLQQAEEPALLVLDNVDQAGWSEWLPAGSVSILVTARDRSFALGKARLLEGLSNEDARALADSLAGAPANAQEQAARDRVVITELGGLAVAVELAGRAVNDWGLRWSRYARELDKQSTLLEDEELLREHYPRGAWAAIDLSLERCPVGETARRVLEGAATFAPEKVPIQWALFAASIEASVEPATDSFEVQRALGRVEGLGLAKVDREGQTLSLHRLVRRRVRDQVTPPEWKAIRRRGVLAVTAWLSETVHWSRIAEVEACRGHADEALSAADELEDDLLWVDIADPIAEHLRYRAEFALSLKLLEQILAKVEALKPPEPDWIAESLSNLASLLCHLGDAARARPLLERALGIDEKTLGPDHPNVAIRLSNLATVLRDLQDAAGARPLLERALAIDEQTFGPNDPNVAIRLSNLAAVLYNLGHAAHARRLLERALWIDQKKLGRDHPFVAIDLFNLAVGLKDQGDAAGARPLLERALSIDEKAFGPDDPKVALRLANLALVLQDLGEPVEAKRLLLRAQAIAEKSLPANHPWRVDIRNSLGNL